MPKLKTRKSVAKRFKVTKKGKVKKKKAFRGHLLGWKSSKRKRRLRKADLLTSGAEASSIKKMLPYG